MSRIEVFEWNPRRYRGRVAARVLTKLGAGARINNFGDCMGSFIVRELCARHGLTFGSGPRPVRLLSVGSVLHFARRGDVVWGSGVNGKVPDSMYPRRDRDFMCPQKDMDVRAVRGPLSRDFLLGRGVPTPEIYGDPALLLGLFYSCAELRAGHRGRGVSIVPNINDYGSFDMTDPRVVLPTEPLMQCIAKIAASELVVGSSLHAIVLADSLGVPARLIASSNESRLKYEDYYFGSGRADFSPANSVEHAIRAGGERALDWDPSPLLTAFPTELFGVEGI